MSAVSLGDTFFKTKKATEEHYRRLLWGGQIGARIPAPASAGLFHLLQRHPEFEAKRGAGIGIRETLHGARAFEVVRHDGSRSEFSFLRCLEPPPSAQRKILDAFRVEVEADILLKREVYFAEHGDSAGRIRCALTDKRITIGESHADHARPFTFANIATAFLAARISDFEQSDAAVEPDDHYRLRLVNRKLAEDWRRFHHQLAHIRLVDKAENIAHARDGLPNPRDGQLAFADLLGVPKRRQA